MDKMCALILKVAMLVGVLTITVCKRTVGEAVFAVTFLSLPVWFRAIFSYAFEGRPPKC